MAVLCKTLNLLFICVPKTASTAISNVLLKEFEGSWIPHNHIANALTSRIFVSYKHSTVKQLLEYSILTRGRLDSLRVFAVTRNPFDWVVSQYLFLRETYSRYENVIKERLRFGGIRGYYLIRAIRGEPIRQLSWIFPHLKLFRDAHILEFEDFAAKYYEGKQMSIAKPYTDGANARVLRFETLGDDFKQAMQTIGIHSPPNLSLVNKTQLKRRHYSAYYTAKSRSIVEAAFLQDIEKYSYTFHSL